MGAAVYTNYSKVFLHVIIVSTIKIMERIGIVSTHSTILYM